MTTAGTGQSQECPKAEHHAKGRKPVSPVHPVPVLKGDDPEDDHELGSDQRLHQTQTPDAERLNLKAKSEDHAQNPQEPNRASEEVADEAQAETQLLGCGGGRPALCHRRGGSEPTGDQRQQDDLNRHARYPLQLPLPQSTTPMVVSTQLVHKSSRNRSRKQGEIQQAGTPRRSGRISG